MASSGVQVMGKLQCKEGTWGVTKDKPIYGEWVSNLRKGPLFCGGAP